MASTAMTAPALILCLALCLAAATTDGSGIGGRQQHLLRLATRRPTTSVSANTTTSSSLGAAVAGRRAGLGAGKAGNKAGRPAERLSHALWLRSTHPRLISTQPQHGKETVVQGSRQLPLDHDETGSAVWTQVYLRCSSSLAPGGPAFVMLSGSAGYDSDWLREGHMADLARKYGADRFFLPTRFFDLDHQPTLDTSVESLKFLNVEQILMDVAAFLDGLLAEGVLQQGQRVILFGAGFGGALATWARQQFPDIVHGVVASSATLEAKYDTYSYFPVVTDAVNWYHRKDLACERYQRQAFDALEAALSTAQGRRDFNSNFQPCTPLSEEAAVSAEDRAQVLGLVASLVADLVQDDEDGPTDRGRPGGDKLWSYCWLLAESEDPPLTTLGRIVAATYPGHCLQTSFQSMVDALSPTDWGSEANAMGVRPWLWLQCTQLGQLPTTVSTIASFPYSTRINMGFYRRLCDAVFGQDTSSSLVTNIQSINKLFGGKEPVISNAIFVTGDLDPWKDLSPSVGLAGTDVHVFNVKRASHAHDMFPRSDFDPPWMKKTRKSIAAIVERWLAAPTPVAAAAVPASPGGVPPAPTVTASPAAITASPNLQDSDKTDKTT